MYGNYQQDILSYPIDLYWRGWRSSTVELQRAGWQLSAQQDVSRHTMMIAINNPEAQLQGLTERIEFDYFRAIQDRMRYNAPNIRLNFEMMGGQIHVMNHVQQTLSHYHDMGAGYWDNFNPIDAEPRMIERKDLNSVAHFQEIQRPQHEIFLKEASMQEILNMALSKQKPMQDEIRKRMIRDEELKRGGRLHTALMVA